MQKLTTLLDEDWRHTPRNSEIDLSQVILFCSHMTIHLVISGNTRLELISISFKPTTFCYSQMSLLLTFCKWAAAVAAGLFLLWIWWSINCSNNAKWGFCQKTFGKAMSLSRNCHCDKKNKQFILDHLVSIGSY